MFRKSEKDRQIKNTDRVKHKQSKTQTEKNTNRVTDRQIERLIGVLFYAINTRCINRIELSNNL